MSLILQLKDYRLTTAHIYQHMPDHPGLLQEFLWQQYDQAPGFPELRKFLDFWQTKLDGKIHFVRVASASLVKTSEWRHTETYLRLH
ncbi:MAG: Usg family protein [Acetobacteraceae bacterium]|nr:Usg family protein [Acetobacteraceae bacterium]MBV8522096.1 Usg family protein [Acetobacteraceae bacterium]